MTPDPRSFNRAAAAAKRKLAFAALHHLDYRRYFFVNLFSTMGDNIEHVISYWLLSTRNFVLRCWPVSR